MTLVPSSFFSPTLLLHSLYRQRTTFYRFGSTLQRYNNGMKSFQSFLSFNSSKPVVAYPRQTVHAVHVSLDPTSPTGFKGLPNEWKLEILKDKYSDLSKRSDSGRGAIRSSQAVPTHHASNQASISSHCGSCSISSSSENASSLSVGTISFREFVKTIEANPGSPFSCSPKTKSKPITARSQARKDQQHLAVSKTRLSGKENMQFGVPKLIENQGFKPARQRQGLRRSATPTKFHGFPVVPKGVLTNRDGDDPVPVQPLQRMSIVPREPIYIEGEDPAVKFLDMKPIGHGSFGTIFSAVNPSGKRVALKKVRLLNKVNQESLKMEIRMMTCTRHVNLVKCYETYVFQGYSWIVMELVDGGNLAEYIFYKRKNGSFLLEREIAFVLREILRGLEFMHGMKRLHRDLKGENVLISLDGKSVKLGDFGFCVELSDENPQRRSLVGTPNWMAPEVIGRQRYAYKADIWSVGIIAIECAQFRPPCTASKPHEAFLEILTQDAPVLSDAFGNWSPDFHRFVRNLLVKDPRGRPTATECLADPFLRNCANRLS